MRSELVTLQRPAESGVYCVPCRASAVPAVFSAVPPSPLFLPRVLGIRCVGGENGRRAMAVTVGACDAGFPGEVFHPELWLQGLARPPRPC